MNKDGIIGQKAHTNLETYAILWHLSGLRQIDYNSVNHLFTCISAKHGPCILKISPRVNETITEHGMLTALDGNRLCKVYEADLVNGVLLIERITPGTPLREEPDLSTRLAIFCGLFPGLHQPPADKATYPTYMDWVSRIAAYTQTRIDYKDLSEKMTTAEEICRRLWEKYPRELLLHGDLHHDNILLGEHGYHIIDPKGVIGDPVFDIPRFILNEADLDQGDKFAYIIRVLAEKLGIPDVDIRLLFYVETCMANSWKVESNREPDWNGVLFAERMMDKT